MKKFNIFKIVQLSLLILITLISVYRDYEEKSVNKILL